MKYLKKFNESVDNDIKLFCNNYLAYLLDDGFKIVYYNRANGIEVDIVKPTNASLLDVIGLQIFSWNDIKDYFIPFIETLKDTYVISNDTFWINTDDGLIDLTTNDIMNDIDNIEIRKIKFIIKNV